MAHLGCWPSPECLLGSLVRRLGRTKAGFDCYLQYFRKVHRIHVNKDTSFQKSFCGPPGKLLGMIWSHLDPLLDCPVALLGHLAAFQGSLGTLLGDPWGALVSLWCHLLSRRVHLGVLGGFFWLLAVS